MYEAFFHFTDRPFAAVPEANRFFPAARIEEARQTLNRAIQRAEGPGLLIGPAGTGKSLLLQVLAAQFRSSFDVVMLASASVCTRRALLQNILFELNLPYRDREEGELRLSLVDHLAPGPRCPNGMLLLVDEADSLPLRLLEEIRMITNLVREGQTRVRLVLAGGPRLEERFAHPKLESFNQRLAARCYLQAMTRQETADYIRFQIGAVHGNADQIFTADAFSAVYQATDGVARLVNQICDHALLLASEAGSERLDAAGIEEAWADLQRLPMPWSTTSPAPTMASPGVIEFGQLDEDDDLGRSVEPNPIVAAQAPPMAPQTFSAAPQTLPTAPLTLPTGPLTLPTGPLTLPTGPLTLPTGPLTLPTGPLTLPTAPPGAWRARQAEPILMTIPDSKTALPSTLTRSADFAATLKITDCGHQAATWSSLSANHPPAAELGALRDVSLANAAPAVGHDPFGDTFEEEEVVVDRYATLDAAAMPRPPRIEVVSATAAAKPQPTKAPPKTETHQAAPSKPGVPTDAPATLPRPYIPSSTRQHDLNTPIVFDASETMADDTFQVVEFANPHFSSPEEAKTLAAASRPTIARIADDQSGTKETAGSKKTAGSEDDRDLILLTADNPLEASRLDQPHAGRAERQEYRQLFARLRRN